jgi:hypothetical protein
MRTAKRNTGPTAEILDLREKLREAKKKADAFDLLVSAIVDGFEKRIDANVAEQVGKVLADAVKPEAF